MRNSLIRSVSPDWSYLAGALPLAALNQQRDLAQPLPQSARNTAPNFPLFGLFQVQISPRLPFRELTQILVHGYDIRSGSQRGI